MGVGGVKGKLNADNEDTYNFSRKHSLGSLYHNVSVLGIDCFLTSYQPFVGYLKIETYF